MVLWIGTKSYETTEDDIRYWNLDNEATAHHHSRMSSYFYRRADAEAIRYTARDAFYGKFLTVCTVAAVFVLLVMLINWRCS